MTRGVISLVSGGMSDHFRRMGTVEMPHMSTRGLLFAVMVIVYTFFYLISFRLMMGVMHAKGRVHGGDAVTPICRHADLPPHRFATPPICASPTYPLHFFLLRQVEQSIMGLEVDEDDNAGHEGLHSAEAEVVVDSEHAGENPNSEEREQSDS
ncbi:hypothetical protein PVIIG_04271 [Plasmodium vivax India VII]|uniref:Uncharacterized protein n=4 Tax=Plasmodium vivax TaxID=5855 RepID=A0A0J9W2E7_PLAVI|nr:hypothetical protein PVIIG_04271 [Plasmodium vivax India VII]KMZ87925.1 hypothetical protein PVBG_05373 [Plasmodium vivax Brazil I]KMZ94333.1 hypothetical protein PVMG_05385 [Plasmodium vivax Mauritania I]KNA00953.1 hypothetical protein PVNG_03060 [Plasmodium vivax North Korean]